MKNFVLILILLTTGISGISQQINEKKLQKFGKKFAKAVISGKPKKCLQFFDHEYVKEQHDHILQGNTMQFVSEFLFGSEQPPMGETETDPPVLSDIAKIEFTSILRNINRDIYAAYDITLRNGKSYKFLAPVRVRAKNKFGFVGAYG